MNRLGSKAQAMASETEKKDTMPFGAITRAQLHETRTYSFFGAFGLGNFGNELTLKAILYHLRRRQPDVRVSCICTHPAATSATHNIAAVPIHRAVFTSWKPQHPLVKMLRSFFVGIPCEIYRWLDAFVTLKHTDVLMIPGTGLLNDAVGLRSWGPYSLFKWSLIAKMRGCKVLFVSVGAGPIYTRIGRWFVRSALALADFRSYRDDATKEFLRSIGVKVTSDRVYPDLVFSMADQLSRKCEVPKRHRLVVGLGLMLYHGKLSSDKSPESTYTAYLEHLVAFVKWLLERDYDIRLLIGDLSDRAVTTEFKALLKDRLGIYDEARILDDSILSVEDLLAQLAATDFVVATRFHNVLLALALSKPVIGISFHQKCASLMQSMGLQEYWQDIKELSADKLIEQFCQLQKNAGSLKHLMREKVAGCRRALDEQYSLIFEDLLLG